MRGVINDAIVSYIKETYGKDILEKVFSHEVLNGIRPTFLITLDYNDEITLDIVKAVKDILDIPPDRFLKEVGRYWSTKYSHKMYDIYYKDKNTAKEFLKYMDRVHQMTVNRIKGISPPRFEYEEPEDNVLIMHYISQRDLRPLMEGLIEGVLEYYGETGKVEEIPSDKGVCAFKITFFGKEAAT